MNRPGKRIQNFLTKHHVLTLATSCKDIPYTSNCFYAYNEEKNLLIFSSDKDTKHIQDLNCGNYVAASVVLETKTVGKIQGVQMNGKLIEPKKEILATVKKNYLKRFPYAVLMKTTLWTLEPDFIKMTDNKLGFGKKLIWENK
ncbi:MAG: pyridoxamine 5'-phosphate oxidase family protein [Bacteroidota bacterium]|nr:pyridoxamine 5'-phosphate oxidase family protein [Bacteroidota bacterium]